MWPVFRATHDALLRVAGLERAFERYGTELAIFRGPTFPLGAPEHFRLLFKFGDQEVHQDLRGRNAQQNLERTRQWFAARGVPDAPESARRFGAKAYLASRYPALVAAKARRELQATDAAVRGSAHYTLGTLFYRAGEYDEAAQELEAAREERPSDPAIAYLEAQTTFAKGDYAAAEPQLTRVLQSGNLSTRQRRRLEAMRSVASQTISATTPLRFH
jgi:tetratricopeptide (TPR) repeat protein